MTANTAGNITGSVMFLDGATSLGSGTVGQGGIATFMTSALAADTGSMLLETPLSRNPEVTRCWPAGILAQRTPRITLRGDSAKSQGRICSGG